jgi:hypothetical protein
MKPRFSLLIFIVALLGVAGGPALAGDGPPAVYTWVDAHGIRHYSDHPANPRAKPLNLATPDAGTTGAASRGTVRPGHPASPQSADAARNTPTPGERAGQCRKLRERVKRLRPARRVEVKKDGKNQFLSGKDLVQFKQKQREKMHAVCAPRHD